MSNQFALLVLERIEAENAQLKSDLQAAREEIERLKAQVADMADYHAIVVEQDDLAIENAVDNYLRAEKEIERLKAQDLTHAVLASDIKLREERDALKAELADVRKELGELRASYRILEEQKERFIEGLKVAHKDRDQALSMAEWLAEALKKCIYDSERLEHGQWAVDQANEALAQYERIKRQLAGEEK